jgi:hypothetical protein
MIPRTSNFLMANLGSEIVRLCQAAEARNLDRVTESCARALHITDELIAHPSLEGRTGEIEILKNVIEDIAGAVPKYDISHKDLESYFMPFAVRALQGM